METFQGICFATKRKRCFPNLFASHLGHRWQYSWQCTGPGCDARCNIASVWHLWICSWVHIACAQLVIVLRKRKQFATSCLERGNGIWSGPISCREVELWKLFPAVTNPNALTFLANIENGKYCVLGIGEGKSFQNSNEPVRSSITESGMFYWGTIP